MFAFSCPLREDFKENPGTNSQVLPWLELQLTVKSLSSTALGAQFK